MMLKTSSRKINPFSNMIAFSVKKNVGIVIITCIAAALYCPGNFLIHFEENKYIYQNNFYNDTLITQFAMVVTSVAAILTVLFNVINFTYLYKKSSSDVFHSLPLTRTELLISRTLSGLISTFIPVLLSYISYAVFIIFNSWMGSITQLLFYLLHTVIIMLVASSFSLVFIISAGSTFDLAVSFLGVNVALLCVGSIFTHVLSQFLFGYNSYVASDLMYNLSPVYFCITGLSVAGAVKTEGVTSQNVDFFIRSFILIIAFTVFSILLYQKRKAEKNGTGYANKFMYLFCSLLAGVCGGYVVGVMFNAHIKSMTFWCMLVVGAILTTCIFGTVTNRSFKKISRSVLIGVIASVILILVAVIGATGAFGYSTYVPKNDKIVSARVSFSDESITYDSPEKVTELHNKIINTRNDINKADEIVFIYIDYTTKNNTTVSRYYSVDKSLIADELLQIYKSEERLENIKKKLNSEKLISQNLYFWFDDEYYNVTVTSDEADEFLNAYWQDVQNLTAGDFLSGNTGTIELSGNTKDNSYYYFTFANYKSYTNIQKFINDKNLIARSEE